MSKSMRKLLEGKFLIALVAVLALLVIAVACGDDEEAPADTPTQPEPEATTPAPAVTPEVGVTATSIKVGVPSFYTGPVADHGTTYARGWEACFRMINDAGGINGRQIEWVSDDTAYDPTQAAGIATKLVTEDEIFAVVAAQDATFHAAAGQYLADEGVPNIGPDGLDPGQFTLPQTFPVGDPAVIGGHILTEYAINEVGVTKIAVGYLPITTLGERFRDGVRETAEDLGVEVVFDQVVAFDFADQAAFLSSARDQGADAIIGLWDTGNHVRFLEAARSIDWVPPKGWFGYSGAHDDMEAWIPFADVQPEFYIYTHFNTVMMENPGDEMQLFADTHEQYFPGTRPTSYAYAAWVACRMFQNVAEDLGDNLTREALVEAVGSLENYDTGMGPVFDYPSNPDKIVNRGGSIIGVMDGEFVQIQDWTEDTRFTEP